MRQQLHNQERRALTGLRGVGAMVVMAYHYALGVGYRIGPGYLMVDMFFVLSGFILALTHAEEFQSENATAMVFRRFLIARFARIYPLYFVLTLAVAALIATGVFPRSVEPIHSLPVSLTLTQNLGVGFLPYGWGQPLIPQSWSISTEVGAYLLFPLILRLCLTRSWLALCFLVIAAESVIVFLASAPPGWTAEPHPRNGPLDIFAHNSLLPLVRCLLEFGIGILAWRATKVLRVIEPSFLMVGDAIVLLLLFALWVVPNSDLAAAWIFAILIVQISTDRSPLSRLLGSVSVHFAGRMSYAIYLLHLPMLGFLPLLTRTLPLGISFIIMACVVFCFSIICHCSGPTGLEVRAIRFGTPKTYAQRSRTG